MSDSRSSSPPGSPLPQRPQPQYQPSFRRRQKGRRRATERPPETQTLDAWPWEPPESQSSRQSPAPFADQPPAPSPRRPPFQEDYSGLGLPPRAPQAAPPAASQSGGYKDALKLRLDLNLEVDVHIKARIKGDITLSLL
ncbi:hypothetical protein C8F04DRAFT_1149834 [Mycena alexandri]|uniref:Uncharacterized protein n=1 Tax=Mycena alexandri TaxID=1745969 RepID=A0AAD6WN91_9AGAR|nr:hypothetical protein C8F04DRAFT_1149834 [Mycena alexandri]